MRQAIIEALEEAKRRGLPAGAATVPKAPELLGTSTKIVKGEDQGVLTTVLYLSPHKESGLNVCPWASKGCVAACLGHSSGRMRFDGARNSRLWKTAFYLFRRNQFNEMLAREIERHEKRARKLGMIPAVRLDGTSDLGIARTFAPRFPNVQFYDYTKSVTRALEIRPSNWHVTFSASETNDDAHNAILDNGVNIATVFHVKRGAALPATWNGRPVIDGDVTDIRFRDMPGHIVGLRAKGKARRDLTGYVKNCS